MRGILAPGPLPHGSFDLACPVPEILKSGEERLRPPSAIEALGKAGIAGGSVYDALVGATAIEHGLKLATRDRRALVTYRALQVDVEVLADQ